MPAEALVRKPSVAPGGVLECRGDGFDAVRPESVLFRGFGAPVNGWRKRLSYNSPLAGTPGQLSEPRG